MIRKSAKFRMPAGVSGDDQVPEKHQSGIFSFRFARVDAGLNQQDDTAFFPDGLGVGETVAVSDQVNKVSSLGTGTKRSQMNLVRCFSKFSAKTDRFFVPWSPGKSRPFTVRLKILLTHGYGAETQ